MREREAFQELDYRAVFGTMAKWATEIDDPARIPEIVSRAFHTACNGRPGPVVIALPEDMLIERVVGARRDRLSSRWKPGPASTDMSRLQKMLVGREAADRAARRQPLVGESLRRAAALCRALRAAGCDDLPARASVRRDCILVTPAIFGIGPNPKLLARVKAPTWCC